MKSYFRILKLVLWAFKESFMEVGSFELSQAEWEEVLGNSRSRCLTTGSVLGIIVLVSRFGMMWGWQRLSSSNSFCFLFLLSSLLWKGHVWGSAWSCSMQYACH